MDNIGDYTTDALDQARFIFQNAKEFYDAGNYVQAAKALSELIGAINYLESFEVRGTELGIELPLTVMNQRENTDSNLIAILNKKSTISKEDLGPVFEQYSEIIKTYDLLID